MSIVYNSSETAKTVNRAIDNNQGTTTTEQGASAAGLIINEDLQNVVQCTNGYMNPIVSKSITGIPPVDFHAVQADIAWSIYGNTDTGVSVGTASDNLFDKNNADVYENSNIVSADSEWIKYTGIGKTIRIPVSAQTQYSISIDSTIETSIFRVLSITTDNIPVVGEGVFGTRLVISSTDNTASFTTPANTKYIIVQFTATLTDTAINSLMLCTGSTPKPYEQYGVKVPIVFNSVTYTAYISDYLRKSSGDVPVYDVMSSDGSLIRAVNADGTAKEEPTTEA